MRKAALIILDGWGIGDNADYNAIYKSKTPNFDKLWSEYPHTILEASGEYVGLPKGQIGGSEVGHLTIGAGRVMYQSLPRISREIAMTVEGQGLQTNNSFLHFVSLAQKNAPHLIGLVSDGGVHSHIDHLTSLLRIMKSMNCLEPMIHVITDGRDTSPQSGMSYIEQLLGVVDELKYGKIVTLCGRYYAMDRDHNWDRTEKAISAMVFGNSEKKIDQPSGDHASHAILSAIQKSYEEQVTDEFIEPVVLCTDYDGMRADQPVLFYNFRSDRMKQLVAQVAAKVGDEQIVTMMKYDVSYPYTYLFDKESLSNTLPEYLSKHGLTQLKAAETEKAPHVTYFFNGGVEVTFDGEVRSIAQSNKLTHDHAPEMKAIEIETHVADYVKEHHPDFILVNFANPDMVGHTGVFSAVVAGVQTVDAQLGKLCDVLLQEGYVCLITADHGNADIMFDPETNEPHTAHTLNPVPFIMVHEELKGQKLDQTPNIGLDRIAGTVCDVMQLEIPREFSASLCVK